VDISGDGSRVVIGDPLFIATPRIKSVRIYELQNGSWTQVGSDILGKTIGEATGNSTAISEDGKRIAFGAMNYSVNDPDIGAARVYEEQNGSWIQAGQDLIGEEGKDEFGFSISLSANGKRVAVGSIENDDKGNNDNDAGHVRVFEEINGSWVQVGADIDGKRNDFGVDRSGFSISLDNGGNRIAIGAPWANTNISIPEVGDARVMELQNGNWVQMGQDLQSPVSFTEGRFGASIALSGDGKVVVVGAPQISHPSQPNGSGLVQAFEWKNGNWNNLGQTIIPTSDLYSIDIGREVAVSSDGKRLAYGSLAGYIKIYDLIGNNWVQLGQNIENIDSVGFQIGSQSSKTVSMSRDGSHIAVGSSQAIPTGQVRVYQVGNPTSINPSYPISSIKLSPNPFSESFQIHTDINEPLLEVSISNMLGEIIYTYANPSKSHTIHGLDKLPAGVYFIKVEFESQFLTKKVIKQY